jgi:hypothetical protein
MIAPAPHPRHVVPSGYRPTGDWLERDDGPCRHTWCRRYDKRFARFARVAIVHQARAGWWTWTVVRVAAGVRAVVAQGSGVYPLPEMARPFADLAARS